MKIAAVLGILMSCLMGMIIYLNYSISSNFEDDAAENASNEERSKTAQSNDLFSLPKEELKKKLGQLNELKNTKLVKREGRSPASARPAERESRYGSPELERSVKEYKRSVGVALSDHYEELIRNPQGMSFNEVEEKRLQVISYKAENGLEAEFMETIPLDQIVAAIMADKNIEEMSLDDIRMTREKFSYDEIVNFFNGQNL